MTSKPEIGALAESDSLGALSSAPVYGQVSATHVMSPKLGSQSLRQAGQEFCAVLRPVRPSLPELDDVSSNFPASADLHHVHSQKGVLPCFLNQSAQPPSQSVESLRRA